MALTGSHQTLRVPKPASDLERFLAGDDAETQDALPVVVLLVIILFIAIGTAL